MGIARSPFRDFESYLRIVVGLDENDIQINLQQYNSILITFEILPGICSIKIYERLFTPWEIMKEPRILNMTILA